MNDTSQGNQTQAGRARARAPRASRSKAQITPQLITDILKDRYHNHFTMVQLKQKHKIGAKNLKKILTDYSEHYLKKFPVKAGAPQVSLDTLNEFWNSSTTQSTQSTQSYEPSSPRYEESSPYPLG